MRLVGLIEVERLLEDVVHTFETLSAVDRPTERTHLDAEFGFYLVEQIERVFALAVHLVDKHHDRRLAHTADLHESARLRLHTFGGIDHDDNRVNGCERAERILGKVLVTRCVKNIDMVRRAGFVAVGWGIIKSHDRGSNADAALLLYLHPVGCGGLADLVALHGSGYVDSAAVKQKFLGQCGLTGIRVRNDGKRPATKNLLLVGGG